jgi:hypothetical protein
MTGSLIGGAASLIGSGALGTSWGFGGGAGTSTPTSVPTGTPAGGMAAMPFKKDGGKIEGPGTGTSDSIPARLSDGEYVIKAAMVKKPGMEKLLSQINSGKVDAKALAAALKKQSKSKKKDA